MLETIDIQLEEIKEEKLAPEQEAELRWYYYVNEIKAREEAEQRDSEA